MHEIITLQFGQRANFLATHFWNAQESYFTYSSDATQSLVDHDIHFRPGIGSDGSETYTPRTVIYDFKSNFGNLRKLNALYEDVGDERVRGLWDAERTVAHRQEKISQTSYQRNLDLGLPTSQLQGRDIRYWSDFNRVFYHPRSIVQLSEYSLSAGLETHEHWQSGDELWGELDRETEESLLDRDVRLFVEESDQLQGFQVFSGVDDVWGGFTNRYVDALIDEFGKKSVWIWAIEDGQQVERQKIIARAANAARSINGISNQVSAYIRCSTQPIHLPRYFHLNPDSLWASTAAIEAAIESVTLPNRLRSRNDVTDGSMSLFEQVLNTNANQRIFDLGLDFRKPGTGDAARTSHKTNGTSNHPEAQEDKAWEISKFDINYTPSFHELANAFPARPRGDDNPNHEFAQIECDRGDQQSLQETASVANMDRDERLQRRIDDEAIIEKYKVPLPFSKIDTFPNDLIQMQDNENRTISLDRLLVRSGLTCTSSMKRTMFELREVVTRGSRVIEREEREDLYNDLTEIGEQYAFGWEDDSGDEDE